MGGIEDGMRIKSATCTAILRAAWASTKTAFWLFGFLSASALHLADEGVRVVVEKLKNRRGKNGNEKKGGA